MYYYTAEGQIMSFTQEGKWKKGFHPSSVEWDYDKKYHLVIKRQAGELTMSVQTKGHVLLSPPAIRTAYIKDSGNEWSFILGDNSISHSQGCMLVQELKLNDKTVELKRLSKIAAVQHMLTSDLPEFGIFKFGKHFGYVQVPEDYKRENKYPFILFFHGRGGTSVENNLLTDDFKTFSSEG